MSENQENNPIIEQNTNYTNYTNTNTNSNTNTNYTIPSQYKPLSAWAYFGYNLLFGLPIIGFIMLIVFSFDSSNINRRNYARSFFCSMLVSFIIVFFILVISFGIVGLSFSSLDSGFNFDFT